MNCVICSDLRRLLISGIGDYERARAAAYYRVSTDIAARIQVDMERAKVALMEHESSCPFIDSEDRSLFQLCASV